MSLRMPKVRDIRVHGAAATIPEQLSAPNAVSGDEIVSSHSQPDLVTVLGFGKDDVLFRTTKANVIQLRDGGGAISAMLVRMKPGVWGFTRRGDPDWLENLGLYGNSDKGV